MTDTKINLCPICKYEYPVCPSREGDVTFGDDIGNDNVCECSCHVKKLTTEEKVQRVKRLQEIKVASEELGTEKEKIVQELDDKVIFENSDGTWTRFTKIDTIKELEEKGTIFRSNPVNRFSTKLETLKNKPKD